MNVFYITMIVILSLILAHALLKTFWVNICVRSLKGLVNVYINLKLMDAYKSVISSISKEDVIDTFLSLNDDESADDKLTGMVIENFNDVIKDMPDLDFDLVYASLFKSDFKISNLKSFNFIWHINDIHDILNIKRYHEIKSYCEEKMNETKPEFN